MSNIFQENASLYWEKGIPVIPLKRFDSPGKGAGKAPILNEWTQYGEIMPSEAVRQHWLASFGNSNIGLPFGPASGLCAIDIDTEDQEMVDAIRAALPPSPWVRVGKKGMGLIYKWQGQPNFKLRDSDNQSIVEFLGKGNQMVMPPSIHPETKQPYTSNTNLWDVLDKIQPLPVDIEKILREALGHKGVSLAHSGRSGPLDVIPQGERDIQMVRHAGYLARVVLGIDKDTKFSLAEAMKHMRHWVENFTQHTSGGDDMDPEKGVAKLVEFLLKDVEGGRTLPKGWDTDLSEEQKAHPSIAEMIRKNAIQSWTVEKARDWLNEKTAHAQTDDERIDIVEELIREVAKDEQFSDLNFGRLIPFLQRASGEFKSTKPDLKNAFKQARKGDGGEEAADHEEIARQVVEEINRGGEILHSQGRFWQWKGAHFEPKDRRDIYMMVAKSVKGNALVRRHSDYEAVTKTIENMVRGELVKALEDGVNFANGFLDVNLQMHDHSPKYGKTFTMPFDYIPERATEAHKWLEFLEQAWGDEPDYAERVMALQEAFAATMFGIAPRYQRAFLLHGKPRTGKSQALEVLRSIMPEDSRTSLPPSLWNERFQLSGMVGKTLNLCGELPEEAVISGEKFKMVVGGEEVPTEFKGRDGFEFIPIAAHWFASNHLPRSRDTSGGFSRRWLIFDFDRVVNDSERIVDYHKVLVAEEREAIAAWAVQGLRRLQQQNEYTLPESHKMRLNQVVRANNSVAAFLQSNDKVRPAQPEDAADLRNVFDHYVYYMKEISKGWSVTYERFRQMIEELGYPVKSYIDGVGIQREEIKGLRLMGQPILPRKPGA